MDEKQAQEYHMLEFNPNDPKSEYITEYTPKKGQGRARAPDWVLDARFRPCPPGGNFATSHRADYPPVSGDHRRTKSKWASRGTQPPPHRPMPNSTESRDAFHAHPLLGHEGFHNINKARAHMRKGGTPYAFPDGELPGSTYNQHFPHHEGHRPPAPITRSKTNRLDAPFDAVSLAKDSYVPIDPQHVPEKARRKNGSVDIFASTLDGRTIYKGMSKGTGRHGFLRTGWGGAADVPAQPETDAEGNAALITGRAGTRDDQEALQRQLRGGMGSAVLGATADFFGDTTYRRDISRPDLLSRGRDWNKRAERW